MKHATRLAVSSLICMFVAALPAVARLPREIALTYEQSITHLDVRL